MCKDYDKIINQFLLEIYNIQRNIILPFYFSEKEINQVNNLKSHYDNFISDILLTITKHYSNFQELDDNIKNSLKKLYNSGWYIDIYFFSIPDIKSLVTFYNQNIINKIDNILCNRYNIYIPELLGRLKTQYPNRIKILKKAFNAHNNNDYELSIPVILSQVDGICYDETGKEYFMKKKGNPKTYSYINNILEKDCCFKSFFEPLTETTPLSFSKAKFESFKNNCINRHSILHGKDTKYANKVNSFKVISFLSYISSIFYAINIRKKKFNP